MPTVLLVEDNPDEQVLYREELRREGYDVILASDGREALEKMHQGMPDLVVLDIWMPGMNGIESLGYILGEHRKLPVILYSSDLGYKDDLDKADLAFCNLYAERTLCERGYLESQPIQTHDYFLTSNWKIGIWYMFDYI